MTAIVLAGLLCLILHDLEPEWSLFHVQDDGVQNPVSCYYLCYRYPRPDYWVERFRQWCEKKYVEHGGHLS